MGEFSKAIETTTEQFVTDRLAKLRSVAVTKGSAFLARQHAYFMLAYRDCKCAEHRCGGCRITLAVATQLENDIAALDVESCDREEAIAAAFWLRKWNELRSFLGTVARRIEDRKHRDDDQQSRLRTGTDD